MSSCFPGVTLCRLIRQQTGQDVAVLMRPVFPGAFGRREQVLKFVQTFDRESIHTIFLGKQLEPVTAAAQRMLVPASFQLHFPELEGSVAAPYFLKRLVTDIARSC